MASFLPRAAKRVRLTSPSASCPRCSPLRPLTTTPTLHSPPPPPPSTSSSPATDEQTTHFGYQSVPTSLKASRVATVFSSVATSYDTMNDLMSLGIHRLWKDTFVRSLNPGSPSPSPPWSILDIAGGTGDIALRMLEHATLINNDSSTHVTVSDINPAMLAEGEKRLRQTEYFKAGRVAFLEANAENLHTVPDASIDLYTVAFGIRNFTDKAAALREAYRVLKPGGTFACLEFSKVTNPLMDAVYKRWSFGAIPLIGQVVAGDRDSYQYLVESIDKFPSQEEFAGMIREAGFVVPGEGLGKGEERAWVDLTGGIAAVHKGVKPLR
ncbi:ubiE/COQ5 methyltransferase family-domain-containing protein [Elsinoe ampelina]|uniref:2-methoxy-6-polyprenyl-1,4-benzoquinol methylase, mitochondrial n=1 Tax=Elsinoe ampelina TaxID=302913 RepID=A0A6A6GNJ9_9PEZI|nr:ubiE/COQ5 methyltransferase family-domain-containing protein [Elsinoe ampelina]